MSVKEYFAIPIIKSKVLDFLKAKGDFAYLHAKHKRQFRAHITLIDKDFYVCDDQHQIKCFFSDTCKEKFSDRYPTSVNIETIFNMLICVQEYQLVFQYNDLETGKPMIVKEIGT